MRVVNELNRLKPIMASLCGQLDLLMLLIYNTRLVFNNGADNDSTLSKRMRKDYFVSYGVVLHRY